MKKLLILTIGLLLLASTAFGQAPVKKPFSIYADVGFTLTNSPDGFKDFHKAGYHFGGGIGMSVAPFVELVGKIGYHQILKDWEIIPGLNDVVDGGNVGIWTFGADFRGSIGAPLAPVKPFGFVGVGFARVSEADITTTDPNLMLAYVTMDDFTKLYYNIGAGVEFGSGIKFFLQGKYLSIKTDSDNLVFIPVSFGIKF